MFPKIYTRIDITLSRTGSASCALFPIANSHIILLSLCYCNLKWETATSIVFFLIHNIHSFEHCIAYELSLYTHWTGGFLATRAGLNAAKKGKLYSPADHPACSLVTMLTTVIRCRFIIKNRYTNYSFMIVLFFVLVGTDVVARSI